MPSLVSTGNCKLGHDCRRVCSHRRRDETRQFRLVGVCGVYWALDTAMMWTVVLNCLAWLSMNCLLVYVCVCVCVYMYVCRSRLLHQSSCRHQLCSTDDIARRRLHRRLQTSQVSTHIHRAACTDWAKKEAPILNK